MYYARFFPFDMMHQWLTYGNDSKVFSRREFSFTIEPFKGEEIYIRYQSFAAVRRCCHVLPLRAVARIGLLLLLFHHIDYDRLR